MPSEEGQRGTRLAYKDHICFCLQIFRESVTLASKLVLMQLISDSINPEWGLTPKLTSVSIYEYYELRESGHHSGTHPLRCEKRGYACSNATSRFEPGIMWAKQENKSKEDPIK